MSQVILDFELDLQQVAELGAVDPSRANPAVVEYSYLHMPVRFEIAGRPMLRYDRAPAESGASELTVRSKVSPRRRP